MSKPRTMDTRIALSITDAMLSRVEQWRREQEIIPSRSDAIRQLVEIGLKAEEINDKYEKLKIVAVEFAKKSGATEDVLKKLNSKNPGDASDNFFNHTLSIGDEAFYYLNNILNIEKKSHHTHPTPKTPTKPKKYQ